MLYIIILIRSNLWEVTHCIAEHIWTSSSSFVDADLLVSLMLCCLQWSDVSATKLRECFLAATLNVEIHKLFCSSTRNSLFLSHHHITRALEIVSCEVQIIYSLYRIDSVSSRRLPDTTWVIWCFKNRQLVFQDMIVIRVSLWFENRWLLNHMSHSFTAIGIFIPNLFRWFNWTIAIHVNVYLHTLIPGWCLCWWWHQSMHLLKLVLANRVGVLIPLANSKWHLW